MGLFIYIRWFTYIRVIQSDLSYPQVEFTACWKLAKSFYKSKDRDSPFLRQIFFGLAI